VQMLVQHPRPRLQLGFELFQPSGFEAAEIRHPSGKVTASHRWARLYAPRLLPATVEEVCIESSISPYRFPRSRRSPHRAAFDEIRRSRDFTGSMTTMHQLSGRSRHPALRARRERSHSDCRFLDVGDVHHGVVARVRRSMLIQSDPESAAAPPDVRYRYARFPYVRREWASTQFWQLVHLATSMIRAHFFTRWPHACCTSQPGRGRVGFMQSARSRHRSAGVNRLQAPNSCLVQVERWQQAWRASA